jgi:hypothetical protein
VGRPKDVRVELVLGKAIPFETRGRCEVTEEVGAGQSGDVGRVAEAVEGGVGHQHRVEVS